jgi:hypothetical protein
VTHQAQVYINTKIFSSKTSNFDVENHILTKTEVTSLLTCLKSDANSYIYSSIVSMGDATLGINRKLLSWATVKLYYATFYALRSLLAINNICIFYMKNSSKSTPFIINVQPGETAKKGSGNTHKLVLETFKKYHVEPYLISQPIDFKDPLEWLIEKREEANYKNAKFIEPQVPKHFKKIIKYGTRRIIQEYLNDTTDIYLFDSDHAILAYPLKTIQFAYNKLLKSRNIAIDQEEINYLCQLFRDDHGRPLSEIHKLLKNV